MSLEAMTWVFNHSEATSGERLVLLGLADHADEMWQSYPSVPTLASKARLSVRQARRCIRGLRQSGRIQPLGWSDRETMIYQIVRDCHADRVDLAERLEREARERGENPADAAKGQFVTPVVDDRGVSPVSPEPSEEKEGQDPSGVGVVDARETLFAAVGDERDEQVLALLLEVPRANGSPRPTVEAVRKVRERHPELDLVVVARELGFWATHGNGARKQIKSVMGTFATFCKRAQEDHERATASQNRPKRVASEASRQGWEREDWT